MPDYIALPAFPASMQRIPLFDRLENPVRLSWRRRQWLKRGLKNLALIPVAPLVGYWAFDATGLTAAFVGENLALQAIMGEGMGHVGLCYSLHHLLTAAKALWKAAAQA